MSLNLGHSLGRLLTATVTAVLTVELALFPVAAQAATTAGDFSLPQEITASGQGSEYVSGNFPGAILMPVNLWGSVAKPGIHHIPARTDLVTLLSLAGGPLADAELDQVTIKRRMADHDELIKVNAEDILTKAGMKSPVLEANDIIIVPREKPTVSPNTVTTIGFIGSVVGLILAGVALGNLATKK